MSLMYGYVSGAFLYAVLNHTLLTLDRALYGMGVGVESLINEHIITIYDKSTCITFLPCFFFNPSNAELNPICHLLALLGAHHIFHISGLRVNIMLMVC